MGNVIVLANQKGGSGKTSVCHHLAGAMAKSGRRVLCVDMDPHSSLTNGFLGEAIKLALHPSRTTASFFSGEAVDPSWTLALPTRVANVSLIPGSDALASFDLYECEGDPRRFAVRDSLLAYRDQFDDVLIDCPPSFYQCTWSAVAAADGLIVPFKPDFYGSLGLEEVQRVLDSVREHANPNVQLLGYLFNQHDGNEPSYVGYTTHFRYLYGQDVFSAEVPLSHHNLDAVHASLPLSHYRPNSPAARSIVALAEEIDRRLLSRACVAA